MNKRAPIIIFILGILLCGGLITAYLLRGNLREIVHSATKPALPKPVAYTPPATVPTNPIPPLTPPHVEEGKAREGASEPIPTEINLAVPFLLQAPKQSWVAPFEDACEEASLLMVDAYYDGRKTSFGADEGTKAILAIVAYEDKAYGYNKDTNAEEALETSQNYFHRPNVEIAEATESNIKSALAKGYPVIAPAYGKALLNPNFRNGGPAYHMLVIKGYTKDGQWITNDPGTKNGPDYLYPKQRLLDAIHDFNKEEMKLGRKVVIIVKP